MRMVRADGGGRGEKELGGFSKCEGEEELMEFGEVMEGEERRRVGEEIE